MRTETKAFSGTKGWLWDIFSCGLPVDYDLEALRRLFLLNLIILVGGFFLALLGTIAFIQRDYILGAVDFSLILFLIWLFFFLRNTRRHIFVGIFGTIVTGIFYFFLIAYGGIDNTAYVWAFTYPLVSLFLLGAKLGSLMSLLLLLMASSVFILGGKVFFCFLHYRAHNPLYTGIYYCPSHCAFYGKASRDSPESTEDLKQRVGKSCWRIGRAR
jgi:hypothetical protein